MSYTAIYPIYDDTLNNILSIAAQNKPGGIPQHILLSGNTGCGKTSLLCRMKKSAESLGFNIELLSFPYTMISVEDIISRFQKKSVLSTILLTDDFHLLIDNLTIQEQYNLRAFLFSNGAPMLIGTINKPMDAITNYKAPFFDAFRIFVLHPEKYYNLFFQPEVLSFLKNEEKWNEIYNIISNNYNYTTQYALNYSNGVSATDCIDKLLEVNSRYFKSLFLSLPKIQQQVVLGIAMYSSETSLSEIRHSAKIDSTGITSALKRLISQSIVKQIGQKKRNFTYVLSDRLFNIWCQKLIQIQNSNSRKKCG